MKLNTFIGLVFPYPGSMVYMLDEDSTVVESGTIREGCRLKVVNPYYSGEKICNLYLTQEKPGTEAFVTSDSMMVDEDSKTIGGDAMNLEVEELFQLVKPFPLATLAVLDADSNLCESGIIEENYMLKVPSGDSSKLVYYDLLFETVIDPSLKESGIEIFPNPANDFITIEGIRKGDKVLVCSLLGDIQKIIEAGSILDGRIPVNNLASGVYFIFIKKGNYQSSAVKLILTNGY